MLLLNIQVHTISCNLVDTESMEKSFVPAFVDTMAAAKRAHEKKESDAKVAAMVERAKELCAGKPVTAPYNRERRRLRLEVCFLFFLATLITAVFNMVMWCPTEWK